MNRTIIQSVILCVCSLCLPLFSSCEPDEPGYNYGNNDVETSRVSKPTFDKYLTTTDYDGFSIRLRFTNGGDERSNMSCTVYWKAYAKKPDRTPLRSDLSRCENMRIIDHTKAKTTFDKSHAGYNGGTYIYYYAECENSAGSCRTDVNYTIVKR